MGIVEVAIAPKLPDFTAEIGFSRRARRSARAAHEIAANRRQERLASRSRDRSAPIPAQNAPIPPRIVPGIGRIDRQKGHRIDRREAERYNQWCVAIPGRPSDPPTRLGRYSLLKRLGVGGMGEVWVGRADDGALVAIKRMLPHLAYDRRAAQMFLDEAKIASTLDHPNVVRILEVDRGANDVHWIAMELVLGETIGRMIDRAKKLKRPIAPRVAAKVIAEAARGVHHAHTRNDAKGVPLGIIHRDVTPPNVMVTDAGEVKVLDFGIAKAMERSSRTEAGAFKGKIEYLSPEQILGSELDARSDVFALGAVLFELLTKKKLFARDTIVATLGAIAECRVPPPSRVAKDVPPTLDAITLKALARDRDERYGSAKELADAIDLHLSNRPVDESELADWVAELCPAELAERRQLAAKTFRRAESFESGPALAEVLERAFEADTGDREPVDFSTGSEAPTQLSRIQKELASIPPPRVEAIDDNLEAEIEDASTSPPAQMRRVSMFPPPPPPKSTVAAPVERVPTAMISSGTTPKQSFPPSPSYPPGAAYDDDDDDDAPPRSRTLLFAGFAALTVAGAVVGGTIVYQAGQPERALTTVPVIVPTTTIADDAPRRPRVLEAVAVPTIEPPPPSPSPRPRTATVTVTTIAVPTATIAPPPRRRPRPRPIERRPETDEVEIEIPE